MEGIKKGGDLENTEVAGYGRVNDVSKDYRVDTEKGFDTKRMGDVNTSKDTVSCRICLQDNNDK